MPVYQQCGACGHQMSFYEGRGCPNCNRMLPGSSYMHEPVRPPRPPTDPSKVQVWLDQVEPRHDLRPRPRPPPKR
jgi:hypothetical protein